MLEHLSVSQVQTFLTCPRKYRFRYLDRLEPERRSTALALGSSVHSAIAWWQVESASSDVELEDVDRVYRADWTSELVAGDYDDLDEPDQVRELGSSLVRLFVDDKAEEPRPLAVDVRFEVELVDPLRGGCLPVPLVGYYDYVGVGLVGEIKTSSRKSSPANWGLQLAAYSYAATQEVGERPQMELVQLVKTKEPRIATERLWVHPAEERWFLEVASEAYQAIRRGQFFPSPSWACRGCEFRLACRGS